MHETELNSIGALTGRQLFGGRITANQIRAKRQLGLVASRLFSSLTVAGIVSIILLRGSG